MAVVAALGQQTQKSMATSEDDAEYEDYEDAEMANSDALAANKQLLNGLHGHKHAQLDGAYDDDGPYGGEDAEGEEDDLSDRDAEGEEDDGFVDAAAALQPMNGDVDDDDASEYEDAEGVGAVKVQPGASDDDKMSVYADEEDSDGSGDNSEYSSEPESEDEVVVLSEAESEVEIIEGSAVRKGVNTGAEQLADGEQDDQAQGVNSNCCIICKREEGDDPSGTSDSILCCAVCGDYAHRSCALTKNEYSAKDDPETWRCKGCITNALEPEHANLALDSPTIQKKLSTGPMLARDLLPFQRGVVKPDSHSVFAHLILEDDPVDGSRHLRRRKGDSNEPDDLTLRASSPNLKRPGRGERQVRSISLVAESGNVKQPLTEGDIDTMVDKHKRSTTPRPSTRSLRATKPAEKPEATIEKSLRHSIVMKFKVPVPRLDLILSAQPKPKKRKGSRVAASASAVTEAPAPPSTVYLPQSYSQPFYPLIDKEVDESKVKPYGDILTEAEADTSKTIPQSEERRLFDKSRQKAEEDWKVKAATEQAVAEVHKKPRKVSGPASQIECINFGGFEIDTWYAAPYPEEYSCNRVLHICEFCLKYMNSEYVAWRHKMKCSAKCPPGDEIYREGSISMFEVDGRKHPVYCQNLCLLAKLFLGSKTLYYDVEPFLFYVMTQSDEYGCHLVGYFSKEKRPSSQNNVSCILTLPIRQRKGYGNLLIDFSYLLTRVERKTGSPEKPLSDMGLVSYRNYWRLVLCYELRHTRNQRDPLSIEDLSAKTGMTADDIVSALEGLRALVRDPVTKSYAIRLDYDFMEEYIKKWEDKKYVKLNPDALVWTPYVMGRNNQHFPEHAPPLTAIAYSEEDDTMAETSQPTVAKGQVNGKVRNEEAANDPDAMDIDAPADEDAKVTNGTDSKPMPPPAPFIPTYRYEIFPPIANPKNGRVSMSGRQTVSTPKTAPARSRPGPSRAGSTRRAAATARKAPTRPKRVSGGTGRGPGRWPKGSKKADFGNAMSGPGLPPRLREQRGKGDQDSDDDDDDILYETPGMNKRRCGSARRGKRAVVSDDEDDIDLVQGDVVRGKNRD